MWWFSISCTLSDLKFIDTFVFFAPVFTLIGWWCFHLFFVCVYEWILQWIFLLINNSSVECMTTINIFLFMHFCLVRIAFIIGGGDICFYAYMYYIVTSKCYINILFCL